MLSGRLYRAAFLPFVLALAVAAFSLTGRPSPLHSTLAPDAFEGSRAFSELTQPGRRLPRPPPRQQRRSGARRLRRAHAARPRRHGGRRLSGAHAPLHRADDRRRAVADDGDRPAPRLDGRQADRDPRPPRRAGRGARAELSATAALLELARVFAARETQRTIVLVSTSGGTGGDAGAAEFAADVARSVRRGDRARRSRRPRISASRSSCPSPTPPGSAPLQLQRTVDDAIKQEAGSDPGAPSAIGQLAHLAFASHGRRTGAAGRGGHSRGARAGQRRTRACVVRPRERSASARPRPLGAQRGRLAGQPAPMSRRRCRPACWSGARRFPRGRCACSSARCCCRR